jgi:hypothetical protein
MEMLRLIALTHNTTPDIVFEELGDVVVVEQGT